VLSPNEFQAPYVGVMRHRARAVHVSMFHCRIAVIVRYSSEPQVFRYLSARTFHDRSTGFGFGGHKSRHQFHTPGCCSNLKLKLAGAGPRESCRGCLLTSSSTLWNDCHMLPSGNLVHRPVSPTVCSCCASCMSSSEIRLHCAAAETQRLGKALSWGQVAEHGGQNSKRSVHHVHVRRGQGCGGALGSSGAVRGGLIEHVTC
jgi:hypothetical protein